MRHIMHYLISNFVTLLYLQVVTVSKNCKACQKLTKQRIPRSFPSTQTQAIIIKKIVEEENIFIFLFKRHVDFGESKILKKKEKFENMTGKH